MSDCGHTSIFVVGTRAQLIKVAPVIRACQERGLSALLMMTGQHRETMDDLLEEFGIEVAREDVVPAGEHASVGSLLRWVPVAFLRLLGRLRSYRRRLCKPPDVLVHGDTLSTLLGALAAKMAGCRVLHVESGLTSSRWFDPFPEEITRRLVFRLTDVAFCPDVQSALRMRGRCAVVVDTEGNTILDAIAISGAASVKRLAPGARVVVSLHRFQNLYDDDRFDHLMEVVARLADRIDVCFVLHPATRKKLDASRWSGVLAAKPRLILAPRMGYRAFLHLAAASPCVLTDGGSNQEELAALGVPTVIMRATTERLDGLGANAIMEADIDGALVDWVAGGHCAALGQAAKPMPSPGPSARIAEFLAMSV